jgi:hypothetical protein
MIWWLVLAAALVLGFLIFRKRSQLAPPSKPTVRPPATRSRLGDFKALEGANCIYEEGAMILKARLLQVSESGDGLQFSLQVLRADGLSEFKEDRINLEASWTSLGYSSQFVHAHYSNWKLFFNKDLIQKIQDAGLAGTDLKTIKRLLLEHQMK